MPNVALIFVPTVNIGGAENFLLKMTKGILPYVDAVHIVFLTGSELGKWAELQNDKTFFHLTHQSRERSGLMPVIKIIRKLSKENNIIYSFSSHTHCNSLLGLLRSIKSLNVRHLIFRESNIIAQRQKGLKYLLFWLFYFLFYRNFDLLICQSDQMKDRLFQCFKWLNKKKIHTMLNPVDMEDITRQTLEPATINILFTNYMVAAGRFIPEKGFDILLNAYSKYRHSGGDLNLLILGDGDGRNDLEEIINELNIQEFVSLPGKVPNPCYFFKNAKLGVVSSIIEGFPNVLLEMMAVCPAVISTLCADGIQNLTNVKTCPVNNIDALAELLSADNDNKENYSLSYDKEIQSRNIPSFIDNIKSKL
jgi:glycosyltransferase involved in cell wall biosynthesis